jgi:hypothetical protein
VPHFLAGEAVDNLHVTRVVLAMRRSTRDQAGGEA